MINSIVGPPAPMVATQLVQSDLPAANAAANQAAPAVVAQAKPAEVPTSEAAPKPAAAPVKEAASKTATSNPLDINVRFRIDQKTKAVTVFLLNERTREVIRTIPPSELAKLTPGDLVNLFA